MDNVEDMNDFEIDTGIYMCVCVCVCVCAFICLLYASIVYLFA